MQKKLRVFSRHEISLKILELKLNLSQSKRLDHSLINVKLDAQRIATALQTTLLIYRSISLVVGDLLIESKQQRQQWWM
jgi:hypothetical protein